ncbi:MAG: leucine-rich repeat domain-containing protein [Treponema sp.]|jgi:hypothetical protein|nr:leucine-rich repeat domain-containing protein [Treponema sp.]
MKKFIVKILIVVIGVLFVGYILFGDKLENYSGQLETNNTVQECTITGFKGLKRSIKIPENIKKIPITKIGERAFSGSEFMETGGLELPETIFPKLMRESERKKKKIPEMSLDDLIYGLFSGKLTKVVIPGTVKIIGKQAFYGNTIKEISFAEGLTVIEYGAFAVNKLTELNIPETVKLINEYAFTGNLITKISIGSNVIVFGESFDNEFAQFYYRNGSLAGTYTYSNGQWREEK